MSTPCTLCGKYPNWPGPSVCDCKGCNTGDLCEHKCYCTEADHLRVSNYNLKDEVTKLKIEISRLKNELERRGP